jgi:hypothetical protein
MSSLIFDEGSAIAQPAKTPRHEGFKSTRKALGSALPTPAASKLKPQTTAKRVLFGDITKGAANNATVRKADGGADRTTGKTPGRKITFQSPAKSARKRITFRDDEGVEEAKEAPPEVAQPEVDAAPALRRGQYRDNTEPIEKPLGRLFDNKALIAELDELDDMLHPDPFPEDAFGADDDGFDAVEDVLRQAGEPYVSEDQDLHLRRLEQRARDDYAKVHADECGELRAPSLDELLPFDNPAEQPLGSPICESFLLADEGEVPFAHLLAPGDPLLAGALAGARR